MLVSVVVVVVVVAAAAVVVVVVVGRINRGETIVAWMTISHVTHYYPKYLYFGHHPVHDTFVSINSLASVPFRIGKTPRRHYSILTVVVEIAVAAAAMV